MTSSIFINISSGTRFADVIKRIQISKDIYLKLRPL